MVQLSKAVGRAQVPQIAISNAHLNYEKRRAYGSIPIYRLLQAAGFEPEQTKAMGQAFEQTLAALGLKDRNDPLVELIAKQVIDIGQRGERDPEQIRDQALKAFIRFFFRSLSHVADHEDQRSGERETKRAKRAAIPELESTKPEGQEPTLGSGCGCA